MFVLITLQKTKILGVELWPVDSTESYEAMQNAAKEVELQGYRCEIHKAY